jgi:hypothetical protein
MVVPLVTERAGGQADSSGKTHESVKEERSVDRVRALPVARCQERGIRSRIIAGVMGRRAAERREVMITGQR